MDVTVALGITARHHLREGLLTLPDTFSGGVCLLDFDVDGDLDIYLPDRAGPALGSPDGIKHNRLLRNEGTRFTDVTTESGAGDTGDSLGCAAADYDGDGDPDLLLTGLAATRLLRNDSGSFVDVTSAVGLLTPASALFQSAAFADVDGDGDLDLFLSAYVDYDPTRDCVGYALASPPCELNPTVFPPLANFLFLNLGDAGFHESAASAALAEQQTTMVQLFYDLDGDDDIDLFVGNDLSKTPDQLYANGGNGTFVEEGAARGIAWDHRGSGMATMGVDGGDVDGDGILDIVESDFEGYPNHLFLGQANGSYRDATDQAGLNATAPLFKWSVNFLDFDSDGDLDLLSVGGHLEPESVQVMDGFSGWLKQPAQLLRNDGAGVFALEEPRADDPLAIPRLGRGAAVGDLDGDLDLDLVLVQLDETLQVMFNVEGDRQNALLIQLVGTQSNRDGIGAEVIVTCGGLRQVRQRTSGAGYLSSSDPRLHFGLGTCSTVESIAIRWPSGTRQQLGPLSANQLLRIVEP